jgi:hypothetical protein
MALYSGAVCKRFGAVALLCKCSMRGGVRHIQLNVLFGMPKAAPAVLLGATPPGRAALSGGRAR